MLRRAVGFGVLASFIFVAEGFALDLNGTNWHGTFTCKGVSSFGGKYVTTPAVVIIAITQAGSVATVNANFGAGNIAYNGKVIDDLTSPATAGVLGMKYPANDPVAANFGEIVWGKVKYDSATSQGTMKLLGLRVTALSGTAFDSCKWIIKTP